MTRRLIATALTLATCLTLPAASRASGQAFTALAPSGLGQALAGESTFANDPADSYNAGIHALDQQRWQDATTAFDKVAKTHGKRADAALYWEAYALNKLGRSGLVAATCNQLRSSYPRSTWNHDCSSLLAAAADPGIYAVRSGPNSTGGTAPQDQVNDNGILIRDKSQKQLEAEQKWATQMQMQTDQALVLSHGANNGAGSDADLKMLALNSLMQRDPAQALPAVRNILTGNGSHQLKQHALVALAMNQSPEAQSLLRDVATGKTAPEEQRAAVQMLGVYQGRRAGDTLTEIYRSSSDRAIKRSAVSGLFISGDATRLVDLARNEKDLQLKHDIVAELALMHDKVATDYMLELLK